ncbi:hypothetical protein RZS08_17110, partial [Arthrospira platensis SPKY1]|nr:hypothetical protein [Arthrospira platensis SPKY1]
ELPYGDLQNAYMEWGGSFAAPNSRVYALEDFLTQSRLKPQIRIPGRHVDIQSFVMYVFREDKPLHAEWFSPGRLAGWDADSLAYWIRPKTSLFMDQLVVADTSGRLLSVPQAFAFHIGKSERDIRWKVVLEEVSEWESGEKERLEEEQALRFRNYRLSEL